MPRVGTMRKVLSEAVKTSCEVTEVLTVCFVATFSIGGIPLLELRDDHAVWVSGWSYLLPRSIKVCRRDWSQLLLGLHHSVWLLPGNGQENVQKLIPNVDHWLDGCALDICLNCKTQKCTTCHQHLVKDAIHITTLNQTQEVVTCICGCQHAKRSDVLTC